ncbi:SIR2 family protein [Bacillus halotolerans]|uniref:SIR2 family NAD-dependent protein deacylase n=1 Tax=Bacillus halotolerans TaxID=260554 RepID=UPI000D02B239|nr:SIR2 family protein [Bacillus halotolerans]PRP55317.1 SIR2 family protein [Bacillus halotolerans]
MDFNMENLRKDYLEGNVVPFIGAGLSVPFKVPTWRELIEEVTNKCAVGEFDFLKKSVSIMLDRNDFWEAINQLKTFINLSDQDIQSLIVEIIEERKIDIANDSLHNYADIGSMDFRLHLTTNYEELLYKYLNCSTYPMLLKDINFSTQDLFDRKRVFHLHGHLSDSGTIVISKEGYEKLYKDEKFENLLRVVTSTKKLLFMGFSFDDLFIQGLIQNHREFFRGQHYIILDNPDDSKRKELKDKYGLATIKYNSDKSSHPEEIRKILSYISERDTGMDIEFEKNREKNIEEFDNGIIVGAKITDLDKKVDDNLFYRKLQIENITPGLRSLSRLFYVAAEIYIRDLKNSGVSIDVINSLLSKVFIKYKERYSDTYEKYGDSQQFIEIVHKSLAEIDFGRRSKLLKENVISDEDENRGLIHILADDENRDVWWGEKRLK